MRKIYQKMERFYYKNRDKGIANLMLYIVLGTGAVCLASMINGGSLIYELLAFDKSLILRGQVWRLFTWIFTNILHSNPFLNVLFLYFFYNIGRTVEMTIGTFKFNLFYAAGIVLMDLFAMISCPIQDVIIGNYLVTAETFSMSIYSGMGSYLHLSLVLAFATTHPDSHFYLFYIIPIRAWVMALVYLVLTVIGVLNMCYPVNLMPHALFPLIGLLNYFLFFGDQMSNLLPLSWRAKIKRKSGPARGPAPGRPIQFPGAGAAPQQKAQPVKADYTHRCTVCGRTDVSHPDLEFRYCSKCNGYHCYCQDHISDHTHIQ